MYLEIVKRQPVLAVSFRAQSFSIAARRSDRHMLSLSLSPDTRRRIGRPHTVFNISSISFEAQSKHFVGVFLYTDKTNSRSDRHMFHMSPPPPSS